MNNPEAKFILRAYRPDGRDAQDPMFSEALAQAGRDPALGQWFARERAADEALCSKLAQIEVPDLRATILAGVKAGTMRRAWWRRTVWLAAAACVALVAGFAVKLRVRPSVPDAYSLSRFALDDVAHDEKDHRGAVPGLASWQARLGDSSVRVAEAAVPEDLAHLRQDGCRSIQVGGREVFEICFNRGGGYHLYIARKSDFETGAGSKEPLFVEQGRLASASWSDARYVYVAVTDAGEAALKRVL